MDSSPTVVSMSLPTAAGAVTEMSVADGRPYRLSNGAHAAFWDQAAVVLYRGAYKGFGRAEMQALTRGVVGWPGTGRDRGELSPPQLEYLERLAGEGVLTTDTRGKAACSAEIAYPMYSLLDRVLGERPVIRPTHRACFFQAMMAARWRQRERWIESHTTWIRALRHPIIGKENIRTLVHVFRHLRPLWLAGRDRCVLDSLALLKFLALCHADVRNISWVVGVQIRPWSAHSWLQSRELVINDTPERVRGYKPILIV